MKKFFLALLAVVCLACLGIAGAACKSAKYYTLYFNTVDGANIVCEIPSGYEVKSGYKVVFQVKLDDGAQGDPEVAVNGDEINADDEGFYSFKMKRDTTVTVAGVSVSGLKGILFDKGDKDGNDYRVTYHAQYLDENNNLKDIDTENKEGTPLDTGTEVVFTIDVSVYYGENPQFEVLSNTNIIEPQNDGKYHVTVEGGTTIAIRGLELDDSFVGRKDGDRVYIDGAGTEKDPYRLRKPIDLFVLSSYMNSNFFYDQLATAFFSLENDIDMKGEELYIIGISSDYMFQGVFNGNGHKISNYFISATAIDQEDYTSAFMPFIGLFGVAASAHIYDLNIENFYCDVDGAPWDTVEHENDYNGYSVGGIVGYGVGVNITNCTVSGTVIASAGNRNFAYIGGIIGYQMSANLESARYYSTVRSCSTDIVISGRAGCVYGAGGIAGSVVSYDETTAAMIINCYSTGDIEGAMRTGGIAGIVLPYGSVTNCYATGYVDANNRVGNDPSYQGARNAYSGGIVGDLGYDAVVANSFFTGRVSAKASSGASYQFAGNIAGNVGSGSEYVHTQKGLIYNCAPSDDVAVKDINNEYIRNTLGWSRGDWTFYVSGYPTVNSEAGSNSFGITLKFKNGTVGGDSELVLDVENAYYPASYWYTQSGLTEFVKADNGNRSYGYYFDEALTVKVPNGFVPTRDVTVWTNFADYGEVAGVYYLQSAQNGSGRYLELTEDGVAVYRDGALSSETYYYYDSATVIIRNLYTEVSGGAVYASYKATVSADGIMTVWDNEEHPAAAPITAVKKVDFGYGKYYNTASGIEYTFNTDGTGLYNNGPSAQPFTYKIENGNQLKVTIGASELTGSVSGGTITVNGISLTAYDKFAGVWELSASLHKQYTFDGKGGWTYLYYGYNATGAAVEIDTASGSYTPDSDGIKLDNNVRFSFKDGHLVSDGEVYFYSQNSYSGTWSNLSVSPYDGVEIELTGVTSEGYGKANITYSSYGSYELAYEVKVGDLSVQTGVDDNGNPVYTVAYSNVPVIRMYSGDQLIASLVFRANSRTLYGNVFDLNSGADKVTTLYLYDDFRGDWISDSMDVTFNGLGNYDEGSGDQNTHAKKGTATVTEGGQTYSGEYILNNNTLSGQLKYNDKTIDIVYNEVTGRIEVKGDTTVYLQHRDEWYNIKLTDGTHIYSFDGKGALTSGGTMTVTNMDGSLDSTVYDYNSKVSIDGNNDYKYNSITLYLYTPFSGTWYVSGTFGKTLVIDNFNATNITTGQYEGKSYNFEYHPDGNYVTMTDPADSNAMPLYINALDGGDVIELAVSTENNTQGDYRVCIKNPVDGYEGDYAYDGGTLTLDGFGSSVFTGGTAKYVKGEEVINYVYEVDQFDYVLISTVEIVQDTITYGADMLFYEKADGEYVKGGVHYAMVRPDALYTINATDKDGAQFVFRGNGIVDTADGEYAYTIVDFDATRMRYTLTLTKDGVEKQYALDYVSDYGIVYYTITAIEASEQQN